MSPPRQELRVVREMLQSAFAADLASLVLFESLNVGGGLPDTLDALLDFVRGALADTIAKRLGDDARDEVIGDIVKVLERARAGESLEELELEIDVEAPVEAPTPKRGFARVAAEPVSVLVCAGTDAFSLRLDASLGPHRVRPLLVRDEAGIRRATFSNEPLLAIVDASDPCPVSDDALAEVLRGMPDGVIRVVWAADHPRARGLLAALDARGVSFCRLVRSEGIDPLLDLVISRRRPPSEPPPTED